MKTLMTILATTLLASVHARADEQGKTPPPVSVKEILSTDVNSAGQAIVFPKQNGHVTVSVFTIQPGATLPVHEHPYPRMGYVLDGTLRVTNLQNSQVATYGAGEFVLESVNEWHKGDNPGTHPLALLVIDLIEKGAQNTRLRQD